MSERSYDPAAPVGAPLTRAEKDVDRGTGRDTEILLTAVQEALTDQAVTRWIDTMVAWGEILAKPEVREFAATVLPLLPHVESFAERMRPLVEAGVLDRLADALGLFMAVQDGVTSSQVERMAMEGEQLLTLANKVMIQDPAEIWITALGAMSTAWQDATTNPQPLGLLSLLRRLRKDQDFQRVVAFLLALSQQLPGREPTDGSAGAGSR